MVSGIQGRTGTEGESTFSDIHGRTEGEGKELEPEESLDLDLWGQMILFRDSDIPTCSSCVFCIAFYYSTTVSNEDCIRYKTTIDYHRLP